MKIGYIALCLLVPLLWGLASARLFDWWQARFHLQPIPSDSKNDHDPPASGDMYHI